MRIIITGGETGGHINLASALNETIKNKYINAKIAYVSAKGRISLKKILGDDLDFYELNIDRFERKYFLKNIILLFKIISSIRVSLRIIKKFKPDVVAGVGGYPEFPMIIAAKLANIPVILIEPNSVPGLSNLVLKSAAEKICTTYFHMGKFFTSKKLLVSGVPIRTSIIRPSLNKKKAIELFKFKQSQPVIFITGGSSGSPLINNLILKDIHVLIENNIQIIWQTGEKDYVKLQNKIKNLAFTGIHIEPFIYNIEQAYAASDLIISSTGAITIAELAFLKKPAIFLPLLESTEGHQLKNALVLIEHGLYVFNSKNNKSQNLATKIIKTLEDDYELQTMSKNISKLSKPKANEIIFSEIQVLYQKKKNLNHFQNN